ncbi:AraC family transcriptional regulator [Murinocardiopsis flavida]|uniref:AraC family transcriptional regulator n=1 Tax=Murinocardiopsis flavida TaxID=645275 RepID=A0A2P8DQA9_9ACTN|nr:AraC family transcriptional regulator [Murinocardiopsis flavida]PSK99391.1 AraC family transcriptional regulator [Murinocardiopsis flavida]
MQDVLADLLAQVRARGAALTRDAYAEPRGVRQAAPEPLTLIVAVRGTHWITVDAPDADAGPPLALHPGEAALLRGLGPYTRTRAPGAPPDLVVHGLDHYTDAAGRPVPGPEVTGTRTCGHPEHPETALVVTGSYSWTGDAGERLLEGLPPLTRVGAGELPVALVDLLAEEVGIDAPGQEAVLERLLDLALVRVLRAVFGRPGAEAPRWWAAQADPVVGRALRALHRSPSEPWTVSGLAEAAGASRATLARRFADLLGESPMAYLADRRMSLAADLLDDPEATVASVARSVGYRDEFAFSTAFKRLRGRAPSAHRGRAAPERPQPSGQESALTESAR